MLKPVGANCVRPLQNQTNFCRKRGCTECPPTSLCRSAPTLASLCRGRGTTKWWWESFKDKVTFPRIRTRTARPYEFVRRARSFEVMPKASLLLTRGFHKCKHSARSRGVAQPSPPSVEGGGEPASRRENFKTKVSFPCNLSHQTSKIQINTAYFAPTVEFLHFILHLLPFTSINFCCIIKTSKENEERI